MEWSKNKYSALLSLFNSESCIAEDYSALYPAQGKVILICIPHREKLFRFVSHTEESYSALYTTPGKVIPLCIPPHTGESYSALHPAPGKVIPHCIPHRWKLFRFVSHTGESYSALYPTPVKVIPHCIPHHGIKGGVCCNNNYFSVYPTKPKNPPC